MDPNQALTDARKAAARLEKLDVDRYEAGDTCNEAWAREIEASTADAARDLAEAFESLDSWLRHGGFLPTDWQR